MTSSNGTTGETTGQGPDPVVAALAGQLDGLRRDLSTATAGQTARTDALAGRVDGVTARVEDTARHLDAQITGLGGQLGEVAAMVDQLTEAVTALSARPRTDPAPTWMLLPADTDTAAEILDGLAGWLRAVYLRYSDAGLPECWCWHPDVVEELLWLMHAWIAAYHGPRAAVALAGDWHDRQRPGVVRRIRAGAGTCSRERHQRRDGWPTAPSGAPDVPAEHELGRIAAWWGPDRDDPAPEPPERNPHLIHSAGPDDDLPGGPHRWGAADGEQNGAAW